MTELTGQAILTNLVTINNELKLIIVGAILAFMFYMIYFAVKDFFG